MTITTPLSEDSSYGVREPRLRVISLGAGVQSTTMALMAMRGAFGPVPDCAIFADTGWEPRKVYEHLDWLESVLTIPVYRVSKGNLRDDIIANTNTTGQRIAAVPWFTVNADGSKGMGRRQCTSEYKLTPIMHKLRDLLGVDRRARIAAGSVEIWIGISTDEAGRMKPPRQQWQTGRWPLLDALMSRQACDDWLWDNYQRHAPKSACRGCPFHDQAAWKDQKENEPDEFADTVMVDKAIRHGGSKLSRSAQYMHADRKPLDEIDFSAKPYGDPRQFDLFDNECEGMCGV